MSNIKIQDVDQRIQYTATSGQTAFTVPFPFFDVNDLVVYKDETKLSRGGGASEYSVSGAGSPSGGTVTLNTGASSGDIITIYDDLAIDRTSIYSATISNLTGSSLNQDFNREVVMMKQIDTTQRLLQLQYAPYAEVSQDDTTTLDRWIPVLGANQVWAKNNANSEIIAYDVPAGGGLAPNDATYLVQTSNSELTNEQVMGDLASGFVVNTTTTGVQLTRTMTGTSQQISITDANGIGGNPTFSIPDNPVMPGTEGMGIPQGTTGQRPSSPSGTEFRFNTSLNMMEFWDGSAWSQLEDSNQFPTTTTDNAIARWDGTGGKLQNSSVLIDDSGNLDLQGSNILDVTQLDFNTSWRFADESVGGVQRLLLRAQAGNQDAEIALSPIGTATQSRFILTDNSNLTNFSSLELSASSSANKVNSAKDGSGTLKPLELAMDDTAAFEIKTSGNIGAKSNLIEDVADPVNPQDAMTLNYFDNNPPGAGGSNTELQYNNGGTLAGISSLTYDGTNITSTRGVTLDGTADEIQLKVQGNGTQTANIFEIETSAGSTLLTFDNSGVGTVTGQWNVDNLRLDGNTLSSTTGDINLSSTGNISAQTNLIKDVVDPSSAQDAATKQYVDNQVGDSGGLQSVQVFTADGTWTKPAGISLVKVVVVGGGGGSGGHSSTSSSDSAESGGGGGGGCAIKTIDVSGTSSESVTVGAGGAGGAAGTNNGGNGGTSSFGAFCSATGGTRGEGGSGTSATNGAAGVDGGTGSNGDLNIDGGSGGARRVVSGNTIFANFGGDTYYAGIENTGAAASAGNSFGGGASGVSSGPSTAAQAGAAGADGVVIVYEYS